MVETGYLLEVIVVLLAVVTSTVLFQRLGLGRAILGQLFWQVASIRATETFAALTLLIALTTAWLAQLAGLSMAFGAFLAGMLLAGTNDRH